jgi:hypothetical protein
MTAQTPYSALLARNITDRINELSEYLPNLPPQQAAQTMREILDPDNGVLGCLASLLATSSHYANSRANSGSFSRGLGLDLADAANRLHDLALDLEDQADEFALLADTTTSPAPAATRQPLPPPAASTNPAGRTRPR